MPTGPVTPREEILAPIVRAYEELAPDGWGSEFVERYFRHTPLDELAARPPEVFAGVAHSHLQLARHRPPGTANVRVYNPTTETDGWSNPRTVLQVVTDDMPFLVDSVTGALVQAGIDIHLVVHPQLVVERDAVGELKAVADRDITKGFRSGAVGELAESWMLLSIDREGDEERREGLERTIRGVLEDVRQAVEDWPKMRSRCLVLAAELEGAPPSGLGPDEVVRATRFLRWMADNHFTFLGYREYTLEGTPQGEVIAPVTGTGLGLLRADPPLGVAPDVLSPEASAIAHRPELLVLTKANSTSTVHRVAHLDYVGVKVYDGRGEVVGERRFLGLYASTAYTESVTRVPVVAEKVQAVLERSGLALDSHTGKDLLETLEKFPRDELFQASVDQIYETAIAVTQLQERRRTKLFVREDEFGRYVSCLVFIPRDRYNTAVRLRMADILTEAFGGSEVEFAARVSESALARLQFVVRVAKGGRIRTLDREQREALERRLVETSRTWSDRLGDALDAAYGEEAGDRLMDRFGRAFPTAYEESFTVSQGVADISHLDRLGPEQGTSVALYRPLQAPDEIRRFKLFRVEPLSLTHILPIFTDMGVEVVDEQPFEVQRSDGAALHVYDFGLRVPDCAVWEACPHERLRELFEGAVAAVWDRRAESDGFNRLVLGAQLTWRQVVILRTVAKYLRQARATYSQSYLEDALVAHPQVARDLVTVWETRFDPDRHADDEDGRAARAEAEEEVAQRVLDALEQVSSLDHDRIIRAFLGVVRAGLRTNYYQPGREGGEYHGYVSLKLDPRAVPDLPAPRPQFEIFVYSPRVEGVHLRFGPVARGGLRWSDRREDFRTEILGLVKAQMVKNAVIVPTGSKGGFYAKALPDPALEREAWLAEGQEAYRTFIRGLLDVTDNRVSGEVVAPERVVRHDGDDPYLVVAADKGTATFSDLANGVAQSYGFWLDDAFASGGSAGYDHKAMGITARGAWESVKRHFREMGRDTQTEDLTVVGVGDMSGDVFGNGMLLSEHIRLVAAFDHRHVFVDPAPDAAASFAERRRLFELPRSSWDDYDRSLVSEGGGVFARSLKSVRVTPQMREALGIDDGVTTMTPAELIHAILLAPADLLWNGGIGTYVKASSEEHLEIGDRANDAIRVDGRQLRVKVVGEGGNLGLSQLGRIEAAFHGVRVNTDAIDNSAGVDTSDHEVNIKILLQDVVRAGGLDTPERNELLASMTDDVAEHVLRDNYEQNVLLGNARAQEHAMVSVHERFMHWLEQRRLLDRALEFLPSDAELEKRHHDGLGLKSPEFSVLVAYAKLALKEDILASTIPDDPYFAGTLAEYFPPPLRERYAAELAEHPLRREIVTNALVNSMVNRGGITFAYRAQEEAGAAPEQVARAFVVAREVFGLADYVRAVEELDNRVPTSAQTELYLEFRRLLDRTVRWFLSARPSQLDIGAEVDRFAGVVHELAPEVPGLLRGEERERLDARAAELEEAGVPAELAVRSASLLDQYSLLDIVDIATDTGRAPTDVAPLYYLLSERFGIDAMLGKVTLLPREDRWDALARGALRDDLYAVLESLTRSVLESAAGSDAADDDPAAQYAVWEASNEESVERATSALSGVLRLERPNIAALSVALRTLRSVIRVGTSA
ncbi:NAD-glutamate dehydrogenase [Phycicoccus endophyticus]|uniref:NAD-glutamate dehydrogenase n=1 Tax=Phycicoccus endophyticus TaxID=1690220 RepID=UPI00140A2081|nr:NAD-glutamate dehydrogenase [Phycicoccus endophyticus]NHI19790.1 NAD-glutamate dehydrogenase [Phycicoccus endophyticus]GGL28566.1 NAD-glutamate dehydrogenase [Phycicoccus endophyticus]